MPSPLVISVEEDGNPEVEADIVEVDPESVKFDNADEDKVELAEPPELPAHGVGGAITPPSDEIRSSEPAKRAFRLANRLKEMLYVIPSVSFGCQIMKP